MAKPQDSNHYTGCAITSPIEEQSIKNIHKFIDDSLACQDIRTGATDIYVLRVKRSHLRYYINARSVSNDANKASDNVLALCDYLQDLLSGNCPVKSVKEILDKAMMMLEESIWEDDLENATKRCKYCKHSRDIGHAKDCDYFDLINQKKHIDINVAVYQGD